MSPVGRPDTAGWLVWDPAAIRALTRAAYARWVPLIGRKPTPMTADYGARVRDHLIDLLEVDGGLAALIEMVPESSHLLVENVALLPELQGRGYGRRMLEHPERVAETLGVGELQLYTNAQFAENVRLYRGLGYEVYREAPHKGGITVYPSKRLARPGA